jgi:subtilisin family serine protease
LKTLPLIHAVAAILPGIASESVKSSPGFLRIDPDIVHRVLQGSEPIAANPSGRENFRDAGITGKGIRIGILDTGIDRSHPGLMENIAEGYDAIGRGDWGDENGHGTHVAGVIGAKKRGDAGIAGMAPEVRLLPIRVLGKSGEGWTSDIIDGIDWCLRNGCRILNLGFGSPFYNRSFEDAVLRAAAAGTLIVSAAGEDPSGRPLYPAGYGHVLAVTAVDDTGRLFLPNPAGTDVDFAGPGLAIYSTYKWGSYATLSGSSMAAAYVTALAALRMEQYLRAGLSPAADTIRRDLIQSSENLGPPGWDPVFGYGIPKVENLTQLPLSE